MNLKSLVSYKAGFELLRIIVVLVLVLSLSFNAFMYYTYMRAITKLNSIIYVMQSDGTMSVAEAKKRDDVRQYQYEGAAKQVYKLWYQIDQNSYEVNVEGALNIFGDCGKKMLKEYKDDQMYFNLRDKNLILSVNITDIKVDLTQRVGMIKGIQTISRLNGKIHRNMDVKFNFYDITPSRVNPFGVKIENWEVINSDKIEDVNP